MDHAVTKAFELHAAFREVVLPTVATHRPGEFGGLVASLWKVNSKVCTADGIAALLTSVSDGDIVYN